MNEKAIALAKKERLNIDDLLEIMRLLRSPGGCPWDIEQTHASIRKNVIEEAYEVAEAIDLDDAALLREELGDLLFQAVFHAQISSETGDFTFDDVVDEVSRKMIVRHPHIFGEVTVSSVGEVLDNWEAIKQETKSREKLSEKLDGIAKTLPALMRASKLSSKLAKAGKTDAPISDGSDEDELGERLYALAREAEAKGIDPEKALSDACERRISAIKAEEIVN